MKRLLLLLLTVSTIFNCYCINKQVGTYSNLESQQNISSNRIKKERITIYNCKNVNGEIIVPKTPLEIFVIEYDYNGLINKSTQHIDNEIRGLIRYRLDERKNLYMTNHISGRLVSKIYKDENGRWVEFFNGKTYARQGNQQLNKPKRSSLLIFMTNLIKVKGGKDINYKMVKNELTSADKNNNAFYFTYSLPDDSGEEVVFTTSEVLEYY
jgi:nuclear transport factor 2 (NTF2) superfamily protein